MRGRLTCVSRDDVLQAVLLGQGVGRFADLSIWSYVRDGLLEQVLLDWISNDSSPSSALFRPEARRDAIVQDFVAFVAGVLDPIEVKCSESFGARLVAARPSWYARRRGRASVAPR